LGKAEGGGGRGEGGRNEPGMPKMRRDPVPEKRKIRDVLWMWKFSSLSIYEECLKRREYVSIIDKKGILFAERILLRSGFRQKKTK